MCARHWGRPEQSEQDRHSLASETLSSCRDKHVRVLREEVHGAEGRRTEGDPSQSVLLEGFTGELVRQLERGGETAGARVGSPEGAPDD